MDAVEATSLDGKKAVPWRQSRENPGAYGTVGNYVWPSVSIPQCTGTLPPPSHKGRQTQPLMVAAFLVARQNRSPMASWSASE